MPTTSDAHPYAPAWLPSRSLSVSRSRPRATTSLPRRPLQGAHSSLGEVHKRLDPLAMVIGVRAGDRKFDFYAHEASPETAPMKDKQTETRWNLAGRGVYGPLKGRELRWVGSVQCRWYAWAAENPETEVYSPRPTK